MSKKSTTIYLQILIFFFVLYCFFVSIELMSGAFKLFGKGFAQQLMISTTNPVIGLMIGIFATSLVQSSSATSSIIVQCGRHFAVLSIKANTHCRGKTIWPVRRRHRITVIVYLLVCFFGIPLLVIALMEGGI